MVYDDAHRGHECQEGDDKSGFEEGFLLDYGLFVMTGIFADVDGVDSDIQQGVGLRYDPVAPSVFVKSNKYGVALLVDLYHAFRLDAQRVVRIFLLYLSHCVANDRVSCVMNGDVLGDGLRAAR